MWKEKILGNIRRDVRNRKALRSLGWTVMRVWEHEVLKDVQLVAASI